MHFSVRHTAAIALMTTLAACGGGGGGSDAASNSWLQFTPSSVEITQNAGQSTHFTVTAKSSKTITQQINIGIIDPTGVITPNVVLTPLTQLEYRVDLQTASSLPVGTHTSTIEVRLCEDNPVTCAKPIDGSPWQVPIKVTVNP